MVGELYENKDQENACQIYLQVIAIVVGVGIAAIVFAGELRTDSIEQMRRRGWTWRFQMIELVPASIAAVRDQQRC